MAAFVFKRTGYAGGPRGRKITISDPAMTRILNAYKTSYGQIIGTPAVVTNGVITTPAVMRDMTDDEVTDKLFDGLLNGLLDAGFATAKSVVRITAESGVTRDVATFAADNV